MLRQEISYEDLNGRTRTDVVFFNLSELEIIDLELNTPGGLEARLKDATDAQDHRKILDFIKELIELSYGEKDDTGKRFFKVDEDNRPLVRNFKASAYYSDFLLGLFENNGAKGVEFITGVLPAALVKQAAEKASGMPKHNAQPNARERFNQVQRDRKMPTPTFEDPSVFETVTEAPAKPVYPSDAHRVESAPQTEEVSPQERLARESEEQHARDRADFEAWKARRDADAASQGISRPPHESGPGTQYNGE